MNPNYTAEEVIANFQALIASQDFAIQLRQLGIGPLQIMRRKQMLLEFKALFIALWRLALARSFPDDGQDIFDAYLQTHSTDVAKSTNIVQVAERARQYADMLSLRGDTDFSEVSRHLLSFLKLAENERRSITLKLALDIRQMYNFIFERMI